MTKLSKKIRTFNITGKVPNVGSGVPVHRRLHVGTLEAGKIYAVLDFKVYPSQVNLVASIHGTLTFGEDDTIEPKTPDFSHTGQFAWSSYCTEVGLAGQNLSQSRHIDDEKYFAKDLNLHVVDETGGQDVNFYVKIAEFDASDDVSSIVQMIQMTRLGE